MSNEEKKEDKKYFGERPEDQEYFIKKSMKWDGWGSPIGLGFFIMAIGVFLFFVSQAGLL